MLQTQKYYLYSQLLLQYFSNIMNSILKYKCQSHSLPILFFCCSRNCEQRMVVCELCRNQHRNHEDKLVPYQSIVPAILRTLNNQNARDVQVLKQNDVLLFQLGKFRKMFGDREKELINGLIKKFEQEKNQILKRVKQEKEKSNSNIVNYFDKMCQKGLLGYRMMFSSQKGLQSLYDGYRKYCQISDISCHVDEKMLPRLQQDDDKELTQVIKRSMTKTLTQSIMNYIKLKISKKDAMKVSCAIGVSSIKPQPSGLPPLSPPRRAKARKTQVQIL